MNLLELEYYTIKNIIYNLDISSYCAISQTCTQLCTMTKDNIQDMYAKWEHEIQDAFINAILNYGPGLENLEFR